MSDREPRGNVVDHPSKLAAEAREILRGLTHDEVRLLRMIQLALMRGLV